ncbi:MAG: hypothetical protein N2112_08760 [Gemmataceae bacterium]|jgi:hypothetical protein|nr:hypothetical protein [Gemmataceae bacterium]
MGLFDQYNPHATPKSARLWAIGGGVVGGILGFIGWLSMYLKEDMPFVAVFFFVPWMTFFCGLAGWAMEWQLPSDEGVPQQNQNRPLEEKGNHNDNGGKAN